MGDLSKHLVKYTLLSRIRVMSWLRAFLKVIFRILEVIFSNWEVNVWILGKVISPTSESHCWEFQSNVEMKTSVRPCGNVCEERCCLVWRPLPEEQCAVEPEWGDQLNVSIRWEQFSLTKSGLSCLNLATRESRVEWEVMARIFCTAATLQTVTWRFSQNCNFLVILTIY